MKTFSAVPALCLVAGVSVLILGWWWFDDSGDYIAVPYVRPLTNYATLQWEPRPVEWPDPDDAGTGHPGRQLAGVHCVRCHSLPEPRQLPRETWPWVLTWMSNYLGFTNTYLPFGNNVEAALMPPKPLVSEQAFQSLAEYYLLYSPEAKDLAPNPGTSQAPTDRFRARVPSPKIPKGELVTSVHWDAAQERFFIGRGTHRTLQLYGRDGTLLLNQSLASEPVDLMVRSNGFRLTIMGDFMENQKGGQVIDFTEKASGSWHSTIVADQFDRLTESHTHDLDGDGADDLLLIGFGAGSLGRVEIRWQGQEELGSERTTLLAYAGALNAQIRDFDRDGRQDVMVLTSQSRQELLLFRNQGSREFERRVIHQEFAGYGYNHLSLGDFDRDGWEDLLLVNGNNMEIKDAPLKPYHGIRILRNNRDLTFAQSYFYPMYGALKAVAHDFDQDDDLDIAAIAFYPNWAVETPETFVFLENMGNNTFQPGGLSSDASGRWICMELGDPNADGWMDLLLGGGYIDQGVQSSFREPYRRWARQRPSFVVLENRGGD